jgi:RNA polymerase sigma factor (sigma-70 family)
MKTNEIPLLSTSKLADRCRENNEKYRHDPSSSDSRYCFELLRRAIWQVDEEAWDHVYKIYSKQIETKIRSRLDSASRETVEDLVQQTWARLYKNITPDTWQDFPDLPRLLSYMNRSAISVTIDHLRQLQRRREKIKLAEELDENSQNNEPDTEVIQELLQKQLWRCIRQVCKDSDEKLLAELVWIYKLKPQAIAAEYPDKFDDAADVSRRKRNLKERLQRAPCMQRIWQEMPQDHK